MSLRPLIIFPCSEGLGDVCSGTCGVGAPRGEAGQRHCPAPMLLVLLLLTRFYICLGVNGQSREAVTIRGEEK